MKKKILLGAIGTMAIPGILVLSCGKHNGKNIDKIRNNAKTVISNIKPTKILVNGAIVPIPEKTAYEAAIKAAHKAIDDAKNSSEVANALANNKLLVEKAKADYENAIKVANNTASELVQNKKANKDIISDIKPTKILVNVAIVPITEKTAYEAAIKVAYKAIDHAKTSDEIKSVFISNKLLVEKAMSDYDNAIEVANNTASELVPVKKANKDIISNIKPTKILVNGAIVPIPEKTAYEAAIKAAHKAIDDAKNSSEVVNALASNKLLVEKARNDYDNAIENSNKFIVVMSRDVAKENMTFDEGTKTLTIGEKVKSIKYNISSIWSDISEIKFSNPENIENIGDYAFQSSKLSTLDLSGSTNLKNIGNYAFSASNLRTLDLSDLTNLESIGRDAFHNSNLTTLDLSGLTNLESIGREAFYCSSKNLMIKANEELWNVIMGKDTNNNFFIGRDIFGTDTSLIIWYRDKFDVVN